VVASIEMAALVGWLGWSRIRCHRIGAAIKS
jgi:hypothetical protein